VEEFWSPMPTDCKQETARLSDTWPQVNDSDTAW
jgi:hypothetical protein